MLQTHERHMLHKWQIPIDLFGQFDQPADRLLSKNDPDLDPLSVGISYTIPVRFFLKVVVSNLQKLIY